MELLYTVKPLDSTTHALEALSAEIKKAPTDKLPKANVIDILQQYREEIDTSLSDLTRVNQEIAGEYIDNALCIKYKTRLMELANVLIASASVINFKIGRGDYRIVPNAVSNILRLKIEAYKGTTPLYSECRLHLQTVKLYINMLNNITRCAHADSFKSQPYIDKCALDAKELLGALDTPFSTLSTVGDLDDYSLEVKNKEAVTKDSLAEAGWSYLKLVEYQNMFSSRMLSLANCMFAVAKAINDVAANNDAARVYAPFTVFAERVTEGLNRVPTALMYSYANPWDTFKSAVLQKPA